MNRPRVLAPKSLLRLGWCLLIAFALTACTEGQIDVRVIPPISRVWPPDRIVLEVGNQAWEIEEGNGGGAVSVLHVSTPQPVRLVRPSDCYVYAVFEAQVGHRYTLLAQADEEVTVQDDTRNAFEHGPGLVATSPSGC